MPLFGFLGGGRLLGGGGGGALRGLLNNRRSSAPQQQRSTAPASSKDAPMAPEPQEQPQQVKPQEQPQEPQQQPPQQNVVQQVGKEIEQPVVQQEAQQKSPISGLLDEAAPSQAVQGAGTSEQPEAPSIVNRTATDTPVAKPSDESFGHVPRTFKPDGVLNQLMDSAGNKQPFDFQDGNPSRAPDLPNQSYSADQGYRYQGPTTVAGALPSRSYGMRF